MILFAQADIGALKADFIKEMVIAVVAFLVLVSFVAVAVVAWMQYQLQKKTARDEEKREREPKQREITPQPLDVVSRKRLSAGEVHARHEEFERRLSGHDAEFDKIWITLRDEDESTRKELRDYVAETNLSLGRIEGKLGTLPKEKQS